MPSLVSLAESILAQAKQLEAVLEENKIPAPSFAVDTLESLPSSATQLRKDLINTSHDFGQLVRGARQSAFDIAYNWVDQLVLRIIWRYRLASAVPLKGSATYAEIAATSGLAESIVSRTLRAAYSLNIFDESSPGQVIHTAISKLLAENDGFYCHIGLQVADLGPASDKLIEAWEKYGADGGEPDQSAFSLRNGGRSLFTVLSEEPDRAHRFDATMKSVVEDEGFGLIEIVKGFDWKSLDKPDSQVVDLAGGLGQVSQLLEKHTQNMTFTVQDLPHVAKKGQENLPAGLDRRISFVGRSFMDPQPAEDPPTAFLISRTLHNWSDRHCVMILRALIPALRSGSKVLIWDSVLEDFPIKKVTERFNFQQDFIMATIFNGKDRSAEEFKQVLHMTDPRFELLSVRRPKGSKLSMVEVTWNESGSVDTSNKVMWLTNANE